MHHHSQIIPSAQRTKTDKIRAIRRRKEQDRAASKNGRGGDGGSSLRKNDLRFRVANPHDEDENGDDYDDLSELDEKEIERLNQKKKREEEASNATESKMEEEEKEEETNYYKENIFNKEDYYLYRAVMFFYCGEYDKSIQDFE